MNATILEFALKDVLILTGRTIALVQTAFF